MKPATIPFFFCAGLSLAACSSVPDVSVNYYHAKSAVAVKVIRTAACSEQLVPFVATDIVIEPSYSRGAKAATPLDIKQLDSFFSSSDIGIEFYEDGRLKSVNTKQTGKGEEIIKTLAEIVGAVVSGASVDPDECKDLREISKKPLTVVFKGKTDFSKLGQDIPLRQDTLDGGTFSKVQGIIGGVKINVTKDADAEAPHNNRQTKGVVLIELRQPAPMTITTTVSWDGGDPQTITASVLSPQHGETYSLPIQKPPLFGENSFELSLAESGTVTKLKYGSGASGVGALSAAQTIQNAAITTTSEKAAKIKAEADLIAQQQRLISCQANAEACK